MSDDDLEKVYSLRRNESLIGQKVAISNSPPLIDGRLFIAPTHSRPSVCELQRVSDLFQSSLPISEAEFVLNCKVVMNVLQYPPSDKVEPPQPTLIVDVVENAVITFVIRILPLVFQELIAPKSLLHPLSPPMIRSLLEVADAHINKYGDFSSQLRMAATHLLIQDNEDVVLAFSMCQILPRIQPNTKWQPVINPVKANPTVNISGSVSLPEIYPPVFSESPSLDCSSLFGSPIPSLSSLLDCTASSASAQDLNHFSDNVITESVSLPIVSLTSDTALAQYSSVPNLRNIIPPVIASEEVLVNIRASPDPEFLFSPSLFEAELSNDEMPAGIDDAIDLNMPDICIDLVAAEGDATDDKGSCSHASTAFASQDDLSRLICGLDVGEEPPSTSLFDLNLGAGIDLSLLIGPPLSDLVLRDPVSTAESLPLSPLPNQASSPLSSPPQILVSDDPDIFRNTFENDHTEQEASSPPYSKRLRSASNPRTIMKRAGDSRRAVSASFRRKEPLDPSLAALTLPPPANPRKVDVNAPTRQTRQKKPRAVSAPRPRTVSASRSNKALLDSDLAALVFPYPANPTVVSEVTVVGGPSKKTRGQGKRSKGQVGMKRDQKVVINVDDSEEEVSIIRHQRSTSASVDKENNSVLENLVE